MGFSNQVEADFTQAITFLKGQYSLWKYSIPYFSSVVDISFAKKYLHLVDDIPQSETINWSIHELFQRDVAWDRVNKEIAAYLRTEDSPQFFNALTIALIPKKGVGFDGVYEDGDYEKLDRSDLDEPTEIGGIQVYYFKGSNETAGRLRWDDDSIIAVAVDGQHRLAAIKQVANLIPSDKAEETKIPVIFIIPDEKAGFVRPSNDNGKAIASPLRQIFTDLNKHARTVSRARQILLDDRDPVSVCVRRLIGEKLGDESDTDRIPLVFIDWLSETNKIDRGPFLTTILQLYEVVSTLMKVPDFADFDEDDHKIKMWARRELGLSSSDEAEIMDQVKRCFGNEVPLTFTKDQIDKIQEGFFKIWGVAIKHLLTGLTDYRNVIDYMRSKDLARPEIINLYSATELLPEQESQEKQRKIIDAIKLDRGSWRFDANFEQPIKYIDDNLKLGRWSFMIVFQKAIFKAYADVSGNAEVIAPGLSGIADRARKNEEFSKVFVQHLNKLLESDLGSVQSVLKGREKFWQGTGLKADEQVEFTKVGKDRIANVLKLWLVMASMDSIPDFDDIDAKNSDLEGMLYNLVEDRRFRAGFGIILKSRDPELSEEELDDSVQLMIKERYEKIKRLLTTS